MKESIWSAEDFKELREKCRYTKPEKLFYRPLAEYIYKLRPQSKVFVDPGELGIDLVELTAEEDLIGYEVKCPALKRKKIPPGLQIFPYELDPIPIFQGIGQALNYHHRGMDCAYLVAPKIEGMEYLPDLLKVDAPNLGLIVVDRNLRFDEVIKPRKVQIYTSEMRELILSLLKWHRPHPYLSARNQFL